MRLRILEIRYINFFMFFMPSTTDRKSVQMLFFPLFFVKVGVSDPIKYIYS